MKSAAHKIEVREVQLPAEVRRDVEDGYAVIEDSAGVVFIETACAGSCKRPYRIDANHPEYQGILAALERGDRSVIVCYHRIGN